MVDLNYFYGLDVIEERCLIGSCGGSFYLELSALEWMYYEVLLDTKNIEEPRFTDIIILTSESTEAPVAAIAKIALERAISLAPKEIRDRILGEPSLRVEEIEQERSLKVMRAAYAFGEAAFHRSG